ncbi:integrase [Mycobacterium sp. 1554424.7]|nr:integrase [Mycobacterium sp. 1554424.7]
MRGTGTAATGLLVAALLTSSPAAGAVTPVGEHQSWCGTTGFCAAEPAPEGGDQVTAEQKIKDGYIQKQINCTPSLPPNPQSITWDPPGFAPNVGGSGVIRDANPQLGGQYRADYVNGRWHIEYPYC